MKLQEMMDIPEAVMSFSDKLPDYDICMIDIHEQNPELFHTEWRDIFQLMRHSHEKEELRKYRRNTKAKSGNQMVSGNITGTIRVC